MTPQTATCQASMSITNFQNLLKLMSIELVMPSNHLLLCRPLLLLPSTFPSIRVFSNESVLYFREPKYWCFRFSISSSNEYSGLISFRFPRAAAPVGVFSQGTTRISGSLSCGAREVRSPCAWRGSNKCKFTEH